MLDLFLIKVAFCCFSYLVRLVALLHQPSESRLVRQWRLALLSPWDYPVKEGMGDPTRSMLTGCSSVS